MFDLQNSNDMCVDNVSIDIEMGMSTWDDINTVEAIQSDCRTKLKDAKWSIRSLGAPPEHDF